MHETATADGAVLWSPPADLRETTEIGRFITWLADRRVARVRDTTTRCGAGRSTTSRASGARSPSSSRSATMPPIRARPRRPRRCRARAGSRAHALNYAEHLLGRDDDRRDRRRRRPLADPAPARADLRRVARPGRAGPRRAPAARGRAGRPRRRLPPEHSETLVAFIATASIGAVWAACAPEFGPRSVIDRFAQIEPSVLLAIPGYGYRDRYVDRRDEAAGDPRRPADACGPSSAVPYGEGELPDAIAWSELLAEPAPLSSSRSRSSTRCTCCSPRARPACRRRSSTATAAS